MCHLSDETLGRSPGEPRICIQGDHVANVGRRDREGTVDRYESGIGGTPKPSIQLMQLAAFTFPSNPFPLALVPHPPAMEQIKSWTLQRRIVALIQLRNAIRRCG